MTLLRENALAVLKHYAEVLSLKLEDAEVSPELLRTLLDSLQEQFRNSETTSFWAESHDRRCVALFGVLCPEEMSQLLKRMILAPVHVIALSLLPKDQQIRASRICDSILNETCDFQTARHFEETAKILRKGATMGLYVARCGCWSIF